MDHTLSYRQDMREFVRNEFDSICICCVFNFIFKDLYPRLLSIFKSEYNSTC